MSTKWFSKAVLGLAAVGLMVLLAAAVSAQPAPPTPAPTGERTPMALRILENGTILVAGSEAPSNIFILGYSPSGAKVSEARLLLPAAPIRVAIHSDGTVAAATQLSTAKGDIWVMKLRGSSGLPLWLIPAVYNGSGNGPDKVAGLGFDEQGNVFVSASTLNSSNRFVFVTLKLDSITGTRHWVQEEATQPTPSTQLGANLPTAMSFNSDQDVQITGKIWDGLDYNFGTTCYAGPTGMKEWPTAVFDSAPGSLDVPTAMITDRFDHINVTGYSTSNGKSVYSTLQYECKTGALRWGPVVFSGPRNSYPTAMALDSNNNAFVTGVSEDNFGRDNFVTIKYHLLNGRQEWSATYRAFNQFGSYPVGMAVDQNDDVVVTGLVTTNHFFDTDFVTMKYNGKTGALMWGPVLFDSKAHSQDVPVAVAVDAEGNFVVTGFVETPIGNRTVTVKYDGLTGSRLWIR